MAWIYNKQGEVKQVYPPQTAKQIKNNQQGTFSNTTQTGQLGLGVGVGGTMNSNESSTKAKFQLVDVTFHYHDEGNLRTELCAIGKYDKNDLVHQSWDNLIFYWFADIEELNAGKIYDPNTDFIVIEYSNVRNLH